MKRTQPYSTLPLPATVDPAGRRCFKVSVPDEQTHIASFFGVLGRLGLWQTWAADDAHTGKDVAAVWRTVIDGIEECDMVNIRLKPTDFCILQLTNDGGLTWTDVADLSDCAHAAAVDEIDLARQRGDIAGGGQQPGIGAGSPGVCYQYDVTLRGNDRWISPVQIEAGDVITVSNAFGAWFDGNGVAPAWRCPDGSLYALGACTLPGVPSMSDPAPAVDHMRLIGNLPADSTTPYFDLYNLAYTVPSGVAAGDLFLQANDDALADNQGSITFHLEICKSLWTHVFDFTIDAQGWAVEPGEQGTYVAGTGWAAAFLDVQNFEVGISIAFSSIRLVDAVMTFDRAGHSGSNASYRVVGIGTTNEGNIVSPGVDGSDLVLSANFTTNKTKLFIQVNNGSSSASALIKRLVVRGTGVDPF